MKRLRKALSVVAFGASLLLAYGLSYYISAADNQVVTNSRYFPETGHTVEGRFLQYWEQNGGLAQQGYPITEEMQELSETDGKTYSVQYFERAVFERHPENQAPYDVLLSLLGVFEYGERYPGGAPAQQPNTAAGSVLFHETGKRLGGKFLEYWRAHGGLPQQGYPISDEFQEVSVLDGKTYTVQYFERAVFELHPENAGTPHEVLLSQLGTFRYRARYQSLNIPAPPMGRKQVMPRGSESFLVWVESNQPTRTNAAYDILGLDLKTNQPVTVTTAVGDQLFPSVSGSTVVWVDTSHSCSTCDYDILGKDLATGREFSVATGPNDQSHPALAGNKVAWVEMSQDAMKLLVKDLTSNETFEAQSFPIQNGTSNGPTFGTTALSEEYLVWSELARYTRESGQVFELRAMNLETREVRSITNGVMGITGATDEISVSGHHLVYGTPDVRLMDLDTGESRVLFKGGASSPQIQGNTVVWIAQSRVWGVRLNEPGATPKQLATEAIGRGDYGVGVVIAGEWIVWNNSGGPNAGKLSAKRLNEAFSK